MTDVDLNKLDAEQLRNLVAQLMGNAADQEQQLQTLQQRHQSVEQRNRNVSTSYRHSFNN